jgi:predicted RNase H-like HicB family nuclease
METLRLSDGTNVTVSIEYDEESDKYIAIFPDLEDTSTFGKDYIECQTRAKEAAEGRLEVLKRKGS